MNTSIVFDTMAASTGLLILRALFGLAMAAHGSQKLFGWFGGYGLSGTGGFFQSLGYRNGKLFAGLAATTEIVSGLLIAVGLFGPVGPALMLSVMIVAAVTVHSKGGFFGSNNGIEMTALYGGAAVALALIGNGALSLDAALGITSAFSPTVTVGALVVGVVGAIGGLMARHQQPAVTADATSR